MIIAAAAPSAEFEYFLGGTLAFIVLPPAIRRKL